MVAAETLGVVSGIIAIVQISKTIISICQFYIDAVDGASSDLQVILIEVSTLKAIAKSLQYLTRPNAANSALLNQLDAVAGPIEGCKKALQELEKLFPPTSVSTNSQGSKRRRLQAAAAALAWPLKQGRAKKLLQEIIQYKATINLALTAEFVHDLKDVKQKGEDIHNLLTESERREIYKWLETTNPCGIHNRSQSLYEPGTGAWMIRTPQWPLWIQGKHRCLWINGIPGAGKSILASHLAEEIEKHCTSSSNENLKLGHAYYYCYFGHDQDESSHFLRWIIGQLCRQAAKIPEGLQNIYESGKTPTLSSLLSVLHGIMERFERVYVILDAVDESIPRADLLRVIRDLSTDARFSALGLLVTSRQYIDIEQVLETCSIPISMSNPFVEEDIRTLVQSTLQADMKYQRWPEDLKHEMLDTIPKKAKGMFRWAICQLDALRGLKTDVSTIKAALLNLPKTLDETYERIFLAIPEDDWLSVQHVFRWLSYHNDLFKTNIPLSTLLLAIQQSTLDLLSQETDQLHDLEWLRERCGCLIMVEPQELSSRFDDKRVYYQRDTVTFAHYTVKEYLQSPRISQKKVGFFTLARGRVQNYCAQVALRQALSIQPNTFSDQCPRDKSLVHSLMDTNFKVYCGVASVLQLKGWEKTISSDATLMELSEALVDPHRPTFGDLTNVLCALEDEYEITNKSGLYADFQFWNVDWIQDQDRLAAIFLNLIITSPDSNTPHLAIAFARRHSMLIVLKQKLWISKEVWDFLDTENDSTYEFIGTIPELVAQWAYRQPPAFNFILDLISEIDSAHFDLSKILLLHTGGHNHNNSCKPMACSLERLLSLGADANGPKGAFVSPLQIAVACWDLHSVEALLNAGAEPNTVGEYGSECDPASLMGKFKNIHGVSSLHIIRHFDCKYPWDLQEGLGLDETVCQKIEILLLKYGAIEIGHNGSKSELSDFVDEIEEVEDDNSEEIVDESLSPAVLLLGARL